jgi:transglutaminase-like putative cysteine protease
MPIFKIQHVTSYKYDRFVKESVNEVRIFSYQSQEQEVLQHDLFITGSPELMTFTDYWGNKTGIFNLLAPHKELVIESRLIVRAMGTEIPLINDFYDRGLLESESKGNLKLIELAKADSIESNDAIRAIIDEIGGEKNSVAAIASNCCAYIFNSFKYIKGITNIETTVDEIIEHRSGVCQDFAHVMLQVLRTLQIPSRYVSGYICPNKNGLRGEGATHAWVEVWVPGYGWAGIDPTNNVWVTNNHVKLAVGRDFNDCSPVKGTFKGPAIQKLSVFVSVGYEDGHVFEEMNNVSMQTQAQIKQQEQRDALAAQQ